MKKSTTPWQDKLHKNQLPVIKEGPEQWNIRSRRLPVCRLPTPELVYEKIKTIPKGEVMTIKELRTKLAEDFDADYTCPLTAGIFLRIAAEAAEEMTTAGNRPELPWWRVIPDDHRAQQPPARQWSTSGQPAQRGRLQGGNKRYGNIQGVAMM
jgi:alkylated DNA nucleotide flippase Atl1